MSISAYDPLYDTVDYGRRIIPAVREEVRRRDERRRLTAKSPPRRPILETVA